MAASEARMIPERRFPPPRLWTRTVSFVRTLLFGGAFDLLDSRDVQAYFRTTDG